MFEQIWNWICKTSRANCAITLRPKGGRKRTIWFRLPDSFIIIGPKWFSEVLLHSLGFYRRRTAPGKSDSSSFTHSKFSKCFLCQFWYVSAAESGSFSLAMSILARRDWISQDIKTVGKVSDWLIASLCYSSPPGKKKIWDFFFPGGRL